MTAANATRVPVWNQADRLRKARESAGLNQDEMAAAIDMSRRSVSAYESGAAIKRATVIAWAFATGVPVEWLRDGVDPSPSGPLAQSVELLTFNPKRAGSHSAWSFPESPAHAA